MWWIRIRIRIIFGSRTRIRIKVKSRISIKVEPQNKPMEGRWRSQWRLKMDPLKMTVDQRSHIRITLMRSKIPIRIGIRIKVKSRIQIHINVIRIRNTATIPHAFRNQSALATSRISCRLMNALYHMQYIALNGSGPNALVIFHTNLSYI